MADHLTTRAAIAREFGVSPRTVTEWTRTADFPAQTKRGWNRKKIDAWCQQRGAGPYHSRKTTRVDEGSCTLAQVNIELRREQAENERIKKERQLVEQATELRELLRYEDVRATDRQVSATVKAVLDAVADARDRELPERCPKKETWKKLRARMLELDRKVAADVAAAMGDLLTE